MRELKELLNECLNSSIKSLNEAAIPQKTVKDAFVKACEMYFTKDPKADIFLEKLLKPLQSLSRTKAKNVWPESKYDYVPGDYKAAAEFIKTWATKMGATVEMCGDTTDKEDYENYVSYITDLDKDPYKCDQWIFFDVQGEVDIPDDGDGEEMFIDEIYNGLDDLCKLLFNKPWS